MKLNLERSVDLAAITASLSERHKHKTGCVLLDRQNRVISVGVNATRTHPLQARYAEQTDNPFKIHLHAEISALTRLRRQHIPHTAIVVRLLANGKRSMAKPCPVCEAALLDNGIEQIFFTDNKGEVQKIY